jgi:predicted acylesterase/phospholipase RssA
VITESKSKLKAEIWYYHDMKKLLLALILLTSLQAKEAKKEFSLIISGGISLGAYEAGYNWALLKYMGHIKHYAKKSDIDMKSIAGASAGAINTLMSAMAWCRSKEALDKHNTIHSNLFHDMWTEVDFEDLFINKDATIDPENQTSLFSRKKIKSLADTIMIELHQPLYERECKVPFGFAVTRVNPKEVTIKNIKIANKLFHIPFYFEVDEERRGHVVDNMDSYIQRDNIIHLAADGKPSDAAVEKAMFASSAFPIAFEQVELAYIYKGEKEKALFLDGGVFDNIPLDLAIRLADSKSTDFIFMDPKNLRRTFVRSKEDNEKSFRQSPINTGIELLMQIFSASESSVLYNTLSEHFLKSDKQIHLSSRYFPITGKFLEHFGAFLDVGFREYDYYVGVYDAIINTAKYACEYGSARGEACEERARKYVYSILTKGSPTSKHFLNLLAKEEFGLPFEEKVYPANKQLVEVFEAIKDTTVGDIDDYHIFIKNLSESDYQPHNKFLIHTLKHPDNWYRKPLANIVQRIVTLEDKNSDNISAGVASVAAYTAGSFYRDKSGWTYNPVSAPLDRDKLWVKALPYEVALTKNMFSLGYEQYYYFEHNKFYLPRAIELKPNFLFEMSNRSDQVNFMRLDLNINYDIKQDFLMVGGGASLYRDFNNQLDDGIGRGFNIYADLLNVFRITYTKRDNYRGREHNVYFGINDIPSFIYWMLDN